MTERREPGKISASMMCADLSCLQNTIEIFSATGVDLLHIDVMDGVFTPNFGLGTDYISDLRKMTSIPLDLHLMIDNPEEKLSWLGLMQSDQVSIHYESTSDLQRAIDRAKERVSKVFLAINPATPILVVEPVLDSIDGVSVLTVNPGFAGQKIVKSCIKKTKKLREFLMEAGYPNMPIEVDGNISFENAHVLRDCGADIFVAGTSSIFNLEDMQEAIKKLRLVVSDHVCYDATDCR